MSRLIDRIIENRQPARLANIVNREELLSIARYKLQELNSRDYKNKIELSSIESIANEAAADFIVEGPIEVEAFDIRRLIDAPVIVADDVGAYTLSLPEQTDMTDVVSCMAPLLPRFFVEFQGIPNKDGYRAWGALVETPDDPEWWLDNSNFGEDFKQAYDSCKDTLRWIMALSTFFERDKGNPYGPITQWLVGLAEDGTWAHLPGGEVWLMGGPVKMTQDLNSGMKDALNRATYKYMISVLLSISFMNCKNVEVYHVDPPEKLSRKHKKKHRHELVRYHILEVSQIRRILEEARVSNDGSLRRALHACRGHFKTFTPDAPLLGKHVGTYWWAPHIRGSKEQGIVLKDYRVSAPREFGRAYREADETPPCPDQEAPTARDPDGEGRGLAAHNRLQNQIAEILCKHGVEPLSPAKDEPEFDIAWKSREAYYVCEVKSATPANEKRQLYMAIGQVIRYRQQLAACGHEPIYSLIAIENRPSDSSWEELCKDYGILLMWPDIAKIQLEKLINT